MKQMINSWFAKKQEELIWYGEGNASDQVGKTIDLNGKKGKVIKGGILTITVEWD